MNKIIQFIYFLISILDKFERNDEKLIHSFEISDINIETDNGFQPLSYIHLTKPFNIYNIKLDNGYQLDCADTHIVYTENMDEIFIKDLKQNDKIMTDKGPSSIINISKSLIKVCMCDATVNDNNHRYYTNGILSHNTTTSALFLLHYIIFNCDKTSLICGNKRRTAVEIMDKVKAIFYEIPYFLKPGVYKWNESDIVLDNGCRIIAEATTINSGIGFTVHCLLCDEFAHIPPNILDPFFNNILPVVTAARAKMIITSTQNGYNLFYRLWSGAKQGISDWSPFEVTWDMVPEWNPDTCQWEKRDESWHQKQIANYGSEEAFNKQFGTNFDIAANTLINTKCLKKLESQAILFENKELPGVEYSDKYFWKPDFEPQTDLRNSYLTVTIDIAEGLEQDYTTYILNKIIDTEGRTECIGVFHANDLTIEQCVKSLQQLAIYHCNQDNTLISIEKNMFGELFVNQIISNIDKFPELFGLFDMSMLVKYYNENGTKYAYGIKITPGNKTKNCILFKNDLERGVIKNNSTLFNYEISNFCDSKGNNTYAASFGHDDVVMAQMQLVCVKQTTQWKNLLDEYSIGKETINDKYYNPYDGMVEVSSFSDIFSDIYNTQKNDNERRLLGI